MNTKKRKPVEEEEEQERKTKKESKEQKLSEIERRMEEKMAQLYTSLPLSEDLLEEIKEYGTQPSRCEIRTRLGELCLTNDFSVHDPIDCSRWCMANFSKWFNQLLVVYPTSYSLSLRSSTSKLQSYKGTSIRKIEIIFQDKTDNYFILGRNFTSKFASSKKWFINKSNKEQALEETGVRTHLELNNAKDKLLEIKEEEEEEEENSEGEEDLESLTSTNYLQDLLEKRERKSLDLTPSVLLVFKNYLTQVGIKQLIYKVYPTKVIPGNASLRNIKLYDSQDRIFIDSPDWRYVYNAFEIALDEFQGMHVVAREEE